MVIFSWYQKDTGGNIHCFKNTIFHKLILLKSQLIPDGKHHENRFKIAAGGLRKLPPAAATAVLGTGRDLNTAKRKNGNFPWGNYVKPWDLGYPNIRQTQIWRKNTGIIHGQILVWYYLTKIYGHSILDYYYSSGSKCAIHGSNWHRICRSDDLQRWWRGSKLKMEQIKRPRLKPTWNIFL